MITRVLAVSALLLILSACSAPYSDLKSPCVGAAGSPCDRHPVNEWWLPSQDES